ncbi:MAG: methionyl-tRNA formyltransferase [Tissierellia bacterium]|nr:methionyl-tRNA formyltransferase [Tissierellia bacterium]
MKLIFMGTPEFSVPSLKKLYEAGFEIPLVITQPDRRSGRGKKVRFSPVKEFALKKGIDVYQPENINTEESKKIISEIKADIMIVVAFGMILKEDILKIPKATINVHASILPKYRGASPINAAIINGDEITGVTIMEVEKGLDSGDILAIEEVNIDGMNSEDLTVKLSEIGGNLLVKVMEDFDNYYRSKKPQDHEKATYTGKITKDMGNIDWSKSSKEILNLVRGLVPWPSAYSYYQGDQFKIHSAVSVDTTKEGQAGEILDISKEGIIIKTGDGAIKVNEFQMPGERKMTVSEYLVGNKLNKEILGGMQYDN